MLSSLFLYVLVDTETNLVTENKQNYTSDTDSIKSEKSSTKSSDIKSLKTKNRGNSSSDLDKKESTSSQVKGEEEKKGVEKEKGRQRERGAREPSHIIVETYYR